MPSMQVGDGLLMYLTLNMTAMKWHAGDGLLCSSLNLQFAHGCFSACISPANDIVMHVGPRRVRIQGVYRYGRVINKASLDVADAKYLSR